MKRKLGWKFDLIEIVHLVAGAFFHTSKVCQLHMTLSAKENKIDVRLFELIIISLTNVVQQLPVEHDIFRLQVPIDDPSLVEML